MKTGLAMFLAVTWYCTAQVWHAPPRGEDYGSTLYSIYDLAHLVRRTVGPDGSMIVHVVYDVTDAEVQRWARERREREHKVKS